MRRAVVEQILREQVTAQPDKDRFTIAESVHLDLLATNSHEVLTLPKVSQVQLHELYLSVVTEKGDTFFLEYEHVLGLRVKKGSQASSAGRAGFAPESR